MGVLSPPPTTVHWYNFNMLHGFVIDCAKSKRDLKIDRVVDSQLILAHFDPHHLVTLCQKKAHSEMMRMQEEKKVARKRKNFVKRKRSKGLFCIIIMKKISFGPYFL